MKKTTLFKGTTALDALMIFLALFFAACENEDTITSKSDQVTLERIDEGLPDNISNETISVGRSNSSTKLITGIDWVGQYPYLLVSHPTAGGGSGYSYGNTIPSNSSTACTVVGDFNGDGVDELIVGYNTPSGPRLIRNTGPYLLNSTIFYSGSTFWTLVGVAAVDFDGDGTDELITALNSPQGPALYKGDATSIGYAKIYQGAPGSLSVVAVAAGDFSGNGHEELITAFNSSAGPSLYRSQGANLGSSFYQGSTFWTIAAVTAADFDNNGTDELITGLNSSLGPAMYKGDATSIGYAKIYQGPTSIGTLRALTSGRFGSACQMHVGFYHSTTGTTVYAHDGTNFLNLVLSWSSPSYVVKSLASGTFRFEWE